MNETGYFSGESLPECGVESCRTENETPPPGPLTVGESIPINIQVGGAYTLNTSVTVISETPNSVTFQTVPGHLLYSATITFSDTSLGNGNVAFNINLSGNNSSFWNGVIFSLGGGSFEDAQWNNFFFAGWSLLFTPITIGEQ